jgi:prepilin signal peptidase PulO-like enzyme (type II secretory pathway)
MALALLIGLFVGIGLIVGVVLDFLIGSLAWASGEGDDESEDTEEVEPAPGTPILHPEAGSLVVERTTSPWPRRLAVMAATAGLFALTAIRYDEPEHLAIVTAYVCVFLICAGTDLVSYRVPNVITYPAIVAAIVIGIFMPHANIWEVLAGGALAGGVLLVPALFTGGVGMGMGDVKLATFVGLSVGFVFVAPAMLIMAIGGGVTAAFLLVTRIRKRGEPIPYAPFISAGGLAVLFWQGTAFAGL